MTAKKITRVCAAAVLALAALQTVPSVAEDITTTQSTSWWNDWGRCTAGIAAGIASGAAAGASVGLISGSVVPGPGNLAGLVAGTGIGAVGVGLIAASQTC
ncbi:MAG: hypothetical protein Q3962_07900 [Corynebacterium sp.]|nr:hypothetical protein [Corynebacterium sp.]